MGRLANEYILHAARSEQERNLVHQVGWLYV
jgi:hypothetical protein